MRDFCFDYFESHPTTTYKDINDFNKEFNVDNSMVSELLQKTEIIRFENMSVDETSELKWRIKGEIASYYFNENSKYLIYSFEDIDISTAVKFLSK